MPRYSIHSRRAFVAGSLAAAAALALPGCATTGAFSFTEAIRRLLVLSSENAFARMTAPGGFWDQQVAAVGLNRFFGTRGNVLANILTSTLFKSRLEGVVADMAVDASYRAAPIVADAVRTIGWANAVDLIRGGPTAASAYLRQEMGPALIDAMVPGVGEALRVAQDPLIGQLMAGLTGVDVGGMANSFAREVDDAIWGEIAREEAAIRADPYATRDPVLIGAFGSAARL
ncbi:MAG TPA: DUF4197 domain-containing protein [Croceibacterium sp.]|nr:DUF4197 domain-containing protein [Croceibacterium sp.]